jgi:UDP-N-acetylglucosamine 3-dehydrogenase
MDSTGPRAHAWPAGAAPVRVGVIGAGVMGGNHVRVLAGLQGAVLAGVVDPAPAARARAAAMAGCPTFQSLDELLALGVDAVTIAAPTHLHEEIALACIARKIHVLVEKPIASTVAGGVATVEAAARAGVTLMAGHVERFNPAVAAIKEAIRGEDLLSIAVTRVGPFPPRMSNVGIVIDLAVHDIDLIRWLTESEITDVQAQLSSAVAEREDIALLQFRTASGVLAQINTNWLTPFKARTIAIATRQKYIMGDLLTRQVTECFDFQPDGSYSMRHLSVAYEEPLRMELAAFIDAVRTGGAPPVTGHEAIACLAIAIRCLEPAGSSAPPLPKMSRRVMRA